MTYAEQHGVHTDVAGWPTGIGNDAFGRLTELAREALSRGPLPIHELYMRMRDDPALRAAATYDWLYSVCDRAARAAGAGLVYKLDP